MLKNHRSLTSCTGCASVTACLLIVEYPNLFRQMLGQLVDEGRTASYKFSLFLPPPVIILRRMMMRTALENNIVVILSTLCFLLVEI
jgi:Fe-S oxidoreductase